GGKGAGEPGAGCGRDAGQAALQRLPILVILFLLIPFRERAFLGRLRSQPGKIFVECLSDGRQCRIVKQRVGGRLRMIAIPRQLEAPPSLRKYRFYITHDASPEDVVRSALPWSSTLPLNITQT